PSLWPVPLDIAAQFVPYPLSLHDALPILVGSFVQVPWASVSVWPCWAVPPIGGAPSFAGGGGTTTAVALALAALLEPPALLAVSWTVIVSPPSPGRRT